MSAARQLPAPGDPFASALEAEASRLATLDAAEAAARSEHAADLAWVTQDRDIALAALDALVTLFVGATMAYGDHGPEERAQSAARLRRQALDAGAEALRKREADHG